MRKNNEYAIDNYLINIINDFERKTSFYIENEKIKEEKENYKSFYNFVVNAWPHSWASQSFIPGLPSDALCEHLEALFYRKIRKLLISLPIRHGKSHILSVLFPVWCWTQNPMEKFLYTSHSEKIASRDHKWSRRLIDSEWFKERWGNIISIMPNTDNTTTFENSLGGSRTSCPMGSGILGTGADIIATDDPNDVRKMRSKTYREEVINLWERGLVGRANNPHTVCHMISQQRLHKQDLMGHILSTEGGKDWTLLNLPMWVTPGYKPCVTKLGDKIWKDPRKKVGELLWPELYDEKATKKLAKELGSTYAVNSQLLLNPTPEGGGLFKKDHFKMWPESKPPKCKLVFTSWDTAITAHDSSCYSAQTTWGIFKDQDGVGNMILLSSWKGRVEMPDLRKIVYNMFNDYTLRPKEPYVILENQPNPVDFIVIEEAANGLSLAQELKRTGIIVNGINPKKYGDKETRAQFAATFLESGRVWVPAVAPNFSKPYRFADELIEACIAFPHDEEGKDLVDSFSQAVIKARKDGLIDHPQDVQWPTYTDKNYDRKPLY